MTPDTTKKFNNTLVAGILGLLTLAVLLFTAPQFGLTWDEPAYIAAAESYAAWMGQLGSPPGRVLSHDTIDLYWEINHEHPPLDKIWSGLVWSVARLAFEDLVAHRLGNMLLVAALMAMLYLMVAETYGRMAGLLAAGALLTLPRFFFHAHLAALDVPAAAVIFAVQHIQYGWIGILMVLVYGIVLGLLRVASGGLFLPVMAHLFINLISLTM